MACCQVADQSLKDWLPCKAQESGGRQCEYPGRHSDEIGHYFSLHTIKHDRMGNGWHCDTVGEPVNTVAYRAKLVHMIAELTAELNEIDKDKECDHVR